MSVAGAGEYPLSIRLRPSRKLLLAVFALHGGAALALLCMKLPWWASAVSLLAVAVSAYQAWRVQRAKAGLALELFSDGGLGLRQTHFASEIQWVSLAPGVVVFPSVIWFALRVHAADGRPRWLRLMLVEGEVGAEWKMLRTWLRHRALEASRTAA
ncbi:hypothetical protein AGMMS49960_03480 [Betaproteobacteria bacterium]|nr:hypothetical protein AGMMS49543_02280 [Betaproteobacteria bacterium]GHT99085.1 hypothetical protein AGMMS49960_03480 [Betaproteobacteria bacterium]